MINPSLATSLMDEYARTIRSPPVINYRPAGSAFKTIKCIKRTETRTILQNRFRSSLTSGFLCANIVTPMKYANSAIWLTRMPGWDPCQGPRRCQGFPHWFKFFNIFLGVIYYLDDGGGVPSAFAQQQITPQVNPTKTNH